MEMSTELHLLPKLPLTSLPGTHKCLPGERKKPLPGSHNFFQRKKPGNPVKKHWNWAPEERSLFGSLHLVQNQMNREKLSCVAEQAASENPTPENQLCSPFPKTYPLRQLIYLVLFAFPSAFSRLLGRRSFSLSRVFNLFFLSILAVWEV